MSEWLIVIGADGTILATAEGAPTDWINRTVSDEVVPAELRDRAAAMLRDFYQSEGPLQTVSVTLADSGQRIRLLALYAVPVRRAETNLADLLQSTVALMKEQAESLDCALTLDVAADLPHTAFVDREKIAWAVTALLGNALRFVRRGTRLMPGGTIVVRARHNVDDARVMIEVQDDGLGIPDERLHDLLLRPPGRLHVTGLGHLLVHEIVTAHGGGLDVISHTDPGQSGTTVRLTLPYR